MSDRVAQSEIELAVAKDRAAREELERVSGKEPLSTWLTRQPEWSRAAADLNWAITARTAMVLADNDQMRMRLSEIRADGNVGRN